MAACTLGSSPKAIKLEVQVQGQSLQHDAAELTAALEGYRLAYIAEDIAQPHIDNRGTGSVLARWCQFLRV